MATSHEEFENLLYSQKQICEGMEKVWTNFKKDGQTRKTADYIKRRVEMLDRYWEEFNEIHQKLIKYDYRDNDYFTGNHYESTKNYYMKAREAIQLTPTEVLLKPATPLAGHNLQSPFQSEQVKLDEKSSEDQTVINMREAVPGPSSQYMSQGNFSKLDELLRKQKTNFKAFSRTLNNINLDGVTERWEFNDTLKNLEARWSNIDNLHWEIDSLLDEQVNTDYEEQFSQHEKSYNNIKREINSKLWSVAHRETSTPKLDIPIFHGNYQQWTSFKDLFTEAIHNNPCLSNAQKMQFLKSKIKGEPERLIQHMPISSENYNTCWEILNHRYNNRKLIFSTHMNTLMSLPAIQQVTSSHIKRLHDVTVECLNGIKNLGVSIDTWDPILVHILSQKLDSETHNDYMSALKQPREQPVLKDFLQFLEIKFTSLESSKRKQETGQQRANNIASSSSFQQNKFKQYYSSNKAISNKPRAKHPQCPVCAQEHGIYFCNQFKEMPPAMRLKTIAKLNLCSNCLYSHNGKLCSSTKTCRECNGSHNSLLHGAFTYQNTQTHKSGSNNSTHVAQQNTIPSEVLLATALVQVTASDGKPHTLRALVDQGSQVSLITEKAAQKLKLPRQKCDGIITGIGTNDNACKGLTNITCSSLRGSHSFNTEAFIMKSLTRNLPNVTFAKPSWEILNDLELADPQFYLSKPIDIILGAEVYADILLDRVRRENQVSPIAQETRLGWILCGKVQNLHCNIVLNNIPDIQKFWEVEDISKDTAYSNEEEECVEFYKSATTRLLDGKYQVRLPLKPTLSNELGQSKSKAIAQFQHQERKFLKNTTVAAQYKDFIDEYLRLGHMTPAHGNKRPECYLPHHCVLRESSTTTSLRVVFNASAKTTNGTSLNDLMFKGPNLQKDLLELLLGWRQYKVVFTADIEKMYRQIWVHADDQALQKIVWRDRPNKLIQEFQLATVTYGTKAAPFLAMMTLRQLAEDESKNYPEASHVIKNSFYMDDVLHGSETIQAALQLKEDLMQLLKAGGFNLRKWRSNVRELSDETNKAGLTETYTFKQPESMKTLGLNWDPVQDVFKFESGIEPANSNELTTTKRQLLSEISKLFDPAGWLTPISTLMKLLFQKIWNENIQWDDKLPEYINSEWLKIKEDILLINTLNIPRWFGTATNSDIELHCFCDASQKAYGCVIYCKAKVQGQNKIILVAGKSKLVPCKKTISLPKLELCGALLLTKLLNKVTRTLTSHNIKTFGWVDSTAVLGWIQGDPERWKAFVANRVRQITQVMPAQCWRYVKSADNPADCASRGLTASQLQNHTLWWQGPTWLRTFNETVNVNSQTYSTDEELKRKQVHVVQKDDCKNESIITELLNKYSSFTKVIHVLSWVRRFISKNQDRRKEEYLTVTEIKQTKMAIIKHIQGLEFGKEIEDLKRKTQISKKSKLANLNPFLCKEGILRVGGRLNQADINSEMKNPAILPHDNRLTELLITHAHKLTYHGGARVTLSFIRQKYWILGGNNATKKHIRRCITCKKQKPDKNYQIMGDLPEVRINPSRPFMHTGVDFTGHVYLKASKGRGIKTTKGYVAVFVCMVTKAVHLELVSDMTTSAFIGAMRRMSARRGAPRHVYSDNGRNFVGASRCLQQEFQEIQQVMNKEFLAEMADMEITWHFNAPSWPSAGGLWEAAVKSFKFHLKRVIGEQKLTYEEFTTLLASIEGCLNSRPLCPLTEDPLDLDYLTPAHFLVGGPTMTLIESETDKRTRWQLTQKIMQDLWKRWRSEYMIQLAARSKWKHPQRDNNMQLNDVVLIHDDNLPPGKWAMGRVIELHQGKDGHVRVVKLRTKSGTMKRPVVKLSLLLENSDKVQHQESDPTPVTNTGSQVNTARFIKLNLTSIFTTLILFLSLVSNSTCDVKVTPFNKNQSLYFDKLSDMMQIRDEWKLIVFYNLEPYWQAISAFETYTKTLRETCGKIREQAHCDVIVLQLSHGFSELEYYNHMLLNQHESTRAARLRRRRRGLIDGIGYVANSLFGVLDERFAEQYRKDIALIQDNEKHIASLWKNQTSIIEAEYNLLKRAENTLSQQHKMINQHMNTLSNALNKLINEVENIKIVDSFNLGATIASNMLRNLKEIQSTLIDTVTDVYHGRFNYHLLNPEQLTSELSTISSKLPKDVTLPIDNIHTDLRKIYNLLRVKTRLLKEVIIFEITIPLTSRDAYELLKIIPIPQAIGNKMINIVPVSDYISINMKKDVYMTLTQYDILSCLVLSNTYFCKLRNLEYQMKEDKNLCQLNFTECETFIKPCVNQWTQTAAMNTYFYFCCNTCSVRTMCGDQVTAHQLTHAGLIIVDQDCIIKTDMFTVFPHKLHLSEMRMKPEIYAPTMAPINRVINITIPKLTQDGNESLIFHQELTVIGEKINKLKDEDVTYSAISYHDVHHYVAIYVLLSIMITTGIVIVVRRFRCVWQDQVPSCMRSQESELTRSTQANLAPPPNPSRSAAAAAPAAAHLRSLQVEDVEMADLQPRLDKSTSPGLRMKIFN